MTPVEWWGALGQVVLVTGLAFIALCAATSVVRFHLMAESIHESEELGLGDEKEFRLSVMTRIALARKEREPLSIALLRLPEGGAPVDEVEARLKPLLRSSDLVMRCGRSLLGLMLGCGSEKAGAVAHRLVSAGSARSLAGVGRWRIGVAGYPEHGFKTSELYPRALDMADEAERAGVLISGMADPQAVAEEKNAPRNMADPLTGLIREDRMIDTMRRYLARERKENRPAALAYMELDQFDRLSAKWPTATTDDLIREVAAFLGERFREKDLLCRFGPAGFVVGMPTAPAEAAAAVERVAEAVRRHVFKAGNATKTSFSAGVAGFPGVQGTASHYFVAAEAALRQARTQGRSQVAVYHPSMTTRVEEEKAGDHL